MLLQNQEKSGESCHPKVLWETHWNLLFVQESYCWREEILIHDVGGSKMIAMRKRRTLQGFGDHMALCEPLGVLLEASWLLKNIVERR